MFPAEIDSVSNIWNLQNEVQEWTKVQSVVKEAYGGHRDLSSAAFEY